jgi:hypothetical protein
MLPVSAALRVALAARGGPAPLVAVHGSTPGGMYGAQDHPGVGFADTGQMVWAITTVGGAVD